MNLSKLFIFCSWICRNTSLIQNETPQLTVDDKIQLLQNIIHTNIWYNDVCKINIILDGKIINLQNSLEKLKKTQNNNEQAIEDTKRKLYVNTLSNLFEISRLMYISLECIYSNVIIKYLVLYFHSAEFDDIYSLKQFTIRMLFNLLSFREMHPNLISSNNTLLLALMSINFFFYNDLKSSLNTNKKTVVSRIINWIELFRCTNCFVSYCNYNTDINNFANFSKTFFEELKKYSFDINFKMLENSKYNEKMYAPAQILLKSLTDLNQSFSIGTIKVKWNGGTKLMSEIAIASVNSNKIKDIFNYQMLLVKVLKDLFCVTFLDKSIDKHNSSVLKNILKAFDVYVNQIIPNNYPSDLYSSIKKIKKLIETDLFKFTSTQFKKAKFFVLPICCKGGCNNGRLSEKTKQILTVSTIIVDTLPLNFAKRIMINDVIMSVKNNQYFKTFHQTFQLLLSESNVLKRYREEPKKINDHLNVASKDDCHEMPQIRTNLFLFYLLIYSQQENISIRKFKIPNFAILSSMEFIKINLAHVYKKFYTNTKIVDIFIPITIYFKNARYLFLEYILVQQYLLLTINLLESYEMDNCYYYSNVFAHNLDIFTNILKDETIQESFANPNQIYNQIKKNTRLLVGDFDEDVNAYLAWVDAFIPNGYFSYYNNGEFNSNIILWNGTKDKIDNVALNITQSVIEIDYLIRYETEVLKLFVLNVFEKLLYIGLNRNKLASAGTAVTWSTIDKDIEELQILLCPTVKKTLTDRVLAESRKILRDPDNETIKEVVSIIEENIMSLRATRTAEDGSNELVSKPFPDHYSLDGVHYSFQTDIEFVSEILKFIKNNNTISENDYFTSTYEEVRMKVTVT